MSSAREVGAHLFRREYDLDHPLDLPPVANLCNALLLDALLAEATGIRLMWTGPDLGNVEYQLDSGWRLIAQVPEQPFGVLINRLKVMAALDIGRVLIQEGELHLRRLGHLHILKIRTEVTDAPYELLTVSGLPGRAA